MTTGTTETISINSTPSGANATLTCGGHVAGNGVTPVTIAIRRDAGDCNVHLAKDGFEGADVRLDQGVNPAYWMNMAFSFLGPAGVYLLSGGDSGEKLIGAGSIGLGFVVFGTDFRTGAVHAHRPGRVDAVLRPRR